MKGVIVEAVGSPYKVVEDLKIPDPTEDQILVKSIATAINPVYVSSILTYPIFLYSDLSIHSTIVADHDRSPGTLTCKALAFW